MTITELDLPGVLLLESRRFDDDRGYFMETYQERELIQRVGESFKPFVQDNLSCSSKGVFRGMHAQKSPYGQSKLVRAVSGRLLDIILDVDPTSDTFGGAVAVELTPESGRAVYIPAHYAHGFVSLEEETRLYYKVDAYYHPESEVAFHYTHPTVLAHLRHFISLEELILSPKDLAAPALI